MKLKMLKKRKALALAKKLEAEKLQLAAKKKQEAEQSSAPSQATEGSEKSSKESVASNASKGKSKLQAVPVASPKRLSPVPEQGGSNEAKTDCNETLPAQGDNNAVPKESKPMVFGSSTTLAKPPMSFGVPTPKSIQSEPDCPKPSFFGASAPVSAALGGAAAAPASAFGTATAAKPSGGSTFLNLTPPGKSGAVPGKFVFGKSANITLAVPSSSPMTAPPKSTFASFGNASAKFGSTPFGSGGGFGGGGAAAFGASPFGGGDASKKRPLASSAEEKSGEPDAKQSRMEEGEIAGDDPKAGGTKVETSRSKNDAAKEA